MSTDLLLRRLKVMEDDAFQKDHMVGWACFRLDRFPTGLQLLRLNGGDGKASSARLLVNSDLKLG